MKGKPGPKTFLLGVGAQKAGTTWLHRYLADSQQVVRGYRKEYHVFDSSDLADEPWRERNLDLAQTALDQLRSGEEADPAHLHRAAMIADPEFYFDYFTGLLNKRPRFRATADVTPEYADLSAERFASIRDGFAARRVRTVAAFLMRDPVDRIWSQIRMQEGRRPARFDVPADQMVERLYDDPQYERFSRYERTMQNLESVWERDQLHYGFYEELFREEEVRGICELLRIEFRTPDFDKVSNVSAGKAVEALPDEVVSKVATHFADTYQAVAERFPDKDLATLWPSSRFVL